MDGNLLHGRTEEGETRLSSAILLLHGSSFTITVPFSLISSGV